MERTVLNLNHLETLLNIDKLTKDDVRKLLDFAFKTKAIISEIKSAYETDFVKSELENLEPRDEIIYDLVKDVI